MKQLFENEWESFTPLQRKQEAEKFYNRAYKIASEAERLLRSYKHSLETWQNYLISFERSSEAYKLASETFIAWSEALEAVMIVFF
jgi:hypothetical protein